MISPYNLFGVTTGMEKWRQPAAGMELGSTDLPRQARHSMQNTTVRRS